MSVTRATTATRVNSAGLVELVPYNLLSYSEQLDDAAWTSINTTETIGATAPDGTATAWTLSKSAANGRLYQAPAVISGSMIFSVYVKAGTLNEVSLETGNSFRTLDLSTGTLVSGGSGTYYIESVGNGWYRFSIVDSAYSGVAIWVSPAANTSGNILVWHPQVNEGSTAKDYQKTETRLNIPRLDYSNGTCPSLLVEPQRTNRLTYSENQGPSGTNWWPTATWSVVNNSVISPSGIQNADTLVEATSNGYHAGYFNSTIANGFTGTYTISAYAKYNGRFFVLSPKDAAQRTYFNLQNGTIAQLGSGVTASIEDAGNGWYRCIVTCSFSSENVNFEYLLASAVGTLIYTGDGTSGVYIWGCQAEEGSYATSYIPTTSASVTRNADVISKTGISSLIGQTEGVVFMDFVYTANDTAGLIPILLSNTSANQLYLWVQTNGRILADFYFGGSAQATITTAIGFAQLNTRYKIAMAYKANDFAFYINGQLVGTDSSGSVSGLNRLDLDYNSLAPTYGPSGQYVNSVALWKTRLTNTQLAQLTTI